MILSLIDEGSAPALTCRRIGPPLLFERLWRDTRCREVVEELLAGRGFEFPVESRRNHRSLARRSQRLTHARVGVERFVGDQCIGLHRGQQVVCSHEVVRLAAGQEQADRVAQRVDQRVDLGAQCAARAPDRLVLTGFFWAPALCWWARTMVLSISVLQRQLKGGSRNCRKAA